MTVFKKLFGKYLLITNTVSCGLMMAGADMIQQRREHWKKSNEYLSSRSCVIAASLDDEQHEEFSSTAVAKANTYMHNYMRTGRTALSVVKKMCLDQTIASPTCLGIFFVGLGVLEHRQIKEIYVTNCRYMNSIPFFFPRLIAVFGLPLNP